MMKKTMNALWACLKDISKKAAVSLFVAVGVLAIANVDSVWREQHGSDYAQVKQEVRKTLRARLPAAQISETTAPAKSSGTVAMVERLSNSLAQDELGDQNPFANLSNLDPLNQVFSRGVIGFQRQAYRSPEYQEEVGYDLLAYDIEQKDHTHTTVLAYLERALIDNPQVTTSADGVKRTPVVMVVENRGGTAHQSLYKNGDLLEQSDLALSTAQALVSHKLNSGIPFFSVAR